MIVDQGDGMFAPLEDANMDAPMAPVQPVHEEIKQNPLPQTSFGQPMNPSPAAPAP